MRLTFKTKTNRFFSKIILICAIILMIISALVSYFLVRQNEPIITSLKTEVQNKQMLIRDIWSNTSKKESRADIAVILSVLHTMGGKDFDQIKKYYLEDFPNLTEKSTVLEVIKEASEETQKNREYINNLYLEQTDLQNKIDEMERKSKFYTDIAFFLQILSVLMIMLLKDYPL